METGSQSGINVIQGGHTCLVCGMKIDDFDELQIHYRTHQKGRRITVKT